MRKKVKGKFRFVLQRGLSSIVSRKQKSLFSRYLFFNKLMRLRSLRSNNRTSPRRRRGVRISGAGSSRLSSLNFIGTPLAYNHVGNGAGGSTTPQGGVNRFRAFYSGGISGGGVHRMPLLPSSSPSRRGHMLRATTPLSRGGSSILYRNLSTTLRVRPKLITPSPHSAHSYSFANNSGIGGGGHSSVNAGVGIAALSATSAIKANCGSIGSSSSSLQAQPRMLTSLGLLGGAAAGVSLSKYSLPVFQVKPGYSTLWRGYRKEYNILMSLPFFRQRRLTNYFLSFKKMRGLSFIYNLELSLFAVLRSSKFFLNDTSSMLSILGSCIFLNGYVVKSPYAQIYVGDCIQLISGPSKF
jgi:hypothetical protein